jgi:hypothetical protein
LIAGAAGSEQPKQPRHREPEPANARFSGANTGINRYSGELHKIIITVRAVAKKSLNQALPLRAGAMQLSGVGDPEHLGRIDVALVHELCGVGNPLLSGTTSPPNSQFLDHECVETRVRCW